MDYDISFLAEQDVWVYADELKISQVIYNLINNAITHTGPDKKVTITQLCCPVLLWGMDCGDRHW